MNDRTHQNPSQNGELSILIVLMGALGDVARGLSLVMPLKSRFPNCRISWLVEPKCEGLVRLHNGIDDVLVFERGRRGAFWKIRQDLRRERFDLVLDLQRHLKSGLLSWLSGAPRRIGFHRRNAKELNWIFNNEHIENCPLEFPKIRHYWKFLEHLGADVPARPDFGLHGVDSASVCAEYFDRLQKPFVALVMGSSWPSKDWIASGYLNLARTIMNQNRYGLILLGDKTQTELAARITEGLPADRILNLAGKTSLAQLVGILKMARACIGPDSGPGHIASALGRPYVSLFGPTSPSRVAPFGSEDLVVQSRIGCSPCYRRNCPGLNKLCMRLIGVEAVVDKLQMAMRER